MAYDLTERAKLFASQINIEPQIVFTIDGIDLRFGAKIVKILARYGEDDIVYGQDGLLYGGTTAASNARDYISLDGTTNTLTQQLEPDKGNSSSTQQMVIRLVDINDEVTEIVTPGALVDDILYRNARVYLGPDEDAAFPEDYIELFNGVIQGVQTGPTYVDFTVAHPEELKRSDLFPKVETKLTQPVYYQSLTIQDIFYQARPDVVGTVSIRYQSGGGTVMVTGNLIDVFINDGVTTAKQVKALIENDPDANQLVTAVITGTPSNGQTLISSTPLVTSSEIFVEDVSLFLTELDPVFKTYVRINDEIIRFTGVDTAANKLTGVTRAQLNTFGFSHEVDDEVFSFYVLGDDTAANGNAIDLSLWILLSGPDLIYLTIDAKAFVQVAPAEFVDNAIFFDGIDIAAIYNVQVGDFVSSTGATNGANNFTDRTVTDIIENELGSYIIVDGAALVLEDPTSAELTFKSQYNILPDGLNLLPGQVDIDEFKRIKNLFDSSIATYSIYFKETAEAKTLLNEVILLPSALYNIPRKGRISVAMTSPPLYTKNTQLLDLSAVVKPSALKLYRSVNKNFYNAIVYKYDIDSLEEKHLAGKVTYSASSQNRIAANVKALTINADGLRPSPNTELLIERNADRLLQRYQFAAESVSVDVPFKVGWAVEVGDPIIFGDEDFRLIDITKGSRDFEQRIFEVQNKSFNIFTGAIKLTLVDTTFDQTKRYAVWSPSTVLGSGSTTTTLVLTNSFGTTLPDKEGQKWINYVGRDIIVHSVDRSVIYQTTIDSIDLANPFQMQVDPPLPGAPPAGYIIDIADYDDINVNDLFLKQVHPFWTPTLTVTSGVSGTQFNVSAPDAAKLYVGSLVRIHNADYSIDSGNTGVEVTAIAGTLITVETSLGFTPAAGQKIDFVGFVSDEGAPYAWV